MAKDRGSLMIVSTADRHPCPVCENKELWVSVTKEVLSVYRLLSTVRIWAKCGSCNVMAAATIEVTGEFLRFNDYRRIFTEITLQALHSAGSKTDWENSKWLKTAVQENTLAFPGLTSP